MQKLQYLVNCVAWLYWNQTDFLLFSISDKPGVINISVKAVCSHPYLIVKWTVADNAGSEITKYTLRWSSGTIGDNLLESHRKTLMVSDHPSLTQRRGNYTITGLNRGIMYNVQVEAANSVGLRTSGTVNKATLSSELISVLINHILSDKEVLFF